MKKAMGSGLAYGRLRILFPLAGTLLDETNEDDFLKVHQTLFGQIGYDQHRPELEVALREQLGKKNALVVKELNTGIVNLANQWLPKQKTLITTKPVEGLIPDLAMILLAHYGIEVAKPASISATAERCLTIISRACEAQKVKVSQSLFNKKYKPAALQKIVFTIEWDAPGLLSRIPQLDEAKLDQISTQIALSKSSTAAISAAQLESEVLQALGLLTKSKPAHTHSALNPTSQFLQQHPDFSTLCPYLIQLEWPLQKLEILHAVYERLFKHIKDSRPAFINELNNQFSSDQKAYIRKLLKISGHPPIEESIADAVVLIIDRYDVDKKIHGYREINKLATQSKRLIEIAMFIENKNHVDIKLPNGTLDDEAWQKRKEKCYQTYFLKLFNEPSLLTKPVLWDNIEKFEQYLHLDSATAQIEHQDKTKSLGRIQASLKEFFPHLMTTLELNNELNTVVLIKNTLFKHISYQHDLKQAKANIENAMSPALKDYVEQERLNFIPKLPQQVALSDYIFDFITALILRYQLVDLLKDSLTDLAITNQCIEILNKTIEFEKALKTRQHKPIIMNIGFKNPALFTQILEDEFKLKIVIFLKQKSVPDLKIQEFLDKLLPILQLNPNKLDKNLERLFYMLSNHPDMLVNYNKSSFEKNPKLIKILDKIARFYDSKTDAGAPAKEAILKGQFFTCLLAVYHKNSKDSFEDAYKLFNQYPNSFSNWAGKASLGEIDKTIQAAQKYKDEIDNDIKLEELISNFLDKKKRRGTKNEMGLARHKVFGIFKDKQKQQDLLASYIKYQCIIDEYNSIKRPNLKNQILMARNIVQHIFKTYILNSDNEHKKFVFKLALYYPHIAKLITTDHNLEKMQAAVTAITGSMNISYDDTLTPYYLKLFFMIPDDILKQDVSVQHLINILKKPECDPVFITLLIKLFEGINKSYPEGAAAIIAKIATDEPCGAKLITHILAKILRSQLNPMDIETLVNFVTTHDIAWDEKQSLLDIINVFKETEGELFLTVQTRTLSAPTGSAVHQVDREISAYIKEHTEDNSPEHKACEDLKPTIIALRLKRGNIIKQFIDEQITQFNSLDNTFAQIAKTEEDLRAFYAKYKLYIKDGADELKPLFYCLALYNPGILQLFNGQAVYGVNRLKDLLNINDVFFQQHWIPKTQQQFAQITAYLGADRQLPAELTQALIGLTTPLALYTLYIHSNYQIEDLPEPLYKNLNYKKTCQILNADEQATRRIQNLLNSKSEYTKNDIFSAEFKNPGFWNRIDELIKTESDNFIEGLVEHPSWKDIDAQHVMQQKPGLFTDKRIKQIAILLGVAYIDQDTILEIILKYRAQPLRMDYPEYLLQICQGILLKHVNVFEFIELLTAPNDSPLMHFNLTQEFRSDLLAYQQDLLNMVFSEEQIHYYARALKMNHANELTLEDFCIELKNIQDKDDLAVIIDQLLHAQCTISDFSDFITAQKTHLDQSIYTFTELKKILGNTDEQALITFIFENLDDNINDYILIMSEHPDGASVTKDWILPALIKTADYFQCSEQMQKIFSGSDPKAKIDFIKSAAAAYAYLNDRNLTWRNAKKAKFKHQRWWTKAANFHTWVETKNSFAKFTKEDRKKALFLINRNICFAYIPPLRDTLNKYYETALQMDPELGRKYQGQDLIDFYNSDPYFRMVEYCAKAKLAPITGQGSQIFKSIEKNLAIDALTQTQKNVIFEIYPKTDPDLMSYYFNAARSDEFKKGLANHLIGKTITKDTQATFMLMCAYAIGQNLEDPSIYKTINTDETFKALNPYAQFELMDHLYHLLYLVKDKSLVDQLISDTKNDLETLGTDEDITFKFDVNVKITPWIFLLHVLVYMGKNHHGPVVLKDILTNKYPKVIELATLVLNQSFISDNNKLGIINELYALKDKLADCTRDIITILIITGRHSLLHSYYHPLKSLIDAKYKSLLKRSILHHNSRKSSMEQVVEILEFIYQSKSSIEIYKNAQIIDTAVKVIYQYPVIAKKFLKQYNSLADYERFSQTYNILFSSKKRTLDKNNLLTHTDHERILYVCLFSSQANGCDNMAKINAEYERLIELDAVKYIDPTTKALINNKKYTITRLLSELGLSSESLDSIPQINILFNIYLNSNTRERETICRYISEKTSARPYDDIINYAKTAENNSNALVLLLKFNLKIKPFIDKFGADFLYANYMRILERYSKPGLNPNTPLHQDLLFYLITFENTDGFFSFMENSEKSEELKHTYILSIIAHGILDDENASQKIIDAIIVVYRSDLPVETKNQLYLLIKAKSQDNSFECNPFMPIHILCKQLGQDEIYQKYLAQSQLDKVHVLPQTQNEIKNYMQAGETLAAYIQDQHKEFLGDAQEYALNHTLMVTAFYKYPVALKKLMQHYPIQEAIDYKLRDRIIAADAKLSLKFAPNFAAAQNIFYLAVFAPTLIDKIDDIDQDQLIHQYLPLFSDRLTLENIENYPDVFWHTLIELSQDKNYLSNKLGNTPLPGIILPVLMIYHHYPNACQEYLGPQPSLSNFFYLVNINKAVQSLIIDNDYPITDDLFVFALKYPQILKTIKCSQDLQIAHDQVLNNSFVPTFSPVISLEIQASTIPADILKSLIDSPPGVTCLQYIIIDPKNDHDKQVKIMTQYNFFASNIDNWSNFKGLPTAEQKTAAAVYLVTKAIEFCQHFYAMDINTVYEDTVFASVLKSLNQLDTLEYKGLDLISQVLGLPYRIGIDNIVDILLIYDDCYHKSPFADAVFDALKDFISQEITEFEYGVRILATQHLPAQDAPAKQALLTKIQHDHRQLANKDNFGKIKFDEKRKAKTIEKFIKNDELASIRNYFNTADVKALYLSIGIQSVDNPSIDGLINYISKLSIIDTQSHTLQEKFIMIEIIRKYKLLQLVDYYLHNAELTQDYFEAQYTPIISFYNDTKQKLEKLQQFNFDKIGPALTEFLSGHLAIKAEVNNTSIKSFNDLDQLCKILNQKFLNFNFIRSVFAQHEILIPINHRLENILDLMETCAAQQNQKLFIIQIDYEYQLFKLIHSYCSLQRISTNEFNTRFLDLGKIRELKIQSLSKTFIVSDWQEGYANYPSSSIVMTSIAQGIAPNLQTHATHALLLQRSDSQDSLEEYQINNNNNSIHNYSQ